MDKLLAYLNSLSPEAREGFAKRCETTVGYLRKACSVKQQLSEGMCLRIAVESGFVVKPEELRGDVDWQYLGQALINNAQAATQSIATQGA